MEFIHAKIWISKNASLCRVFANRVTFIVITHGKNTFDNVAIIVTTIYVHSKDDWLTQSVQLVMSRIMDCVCLDEITT